jgi:hypothetical protein
MVYCMLLFYMSQIEALYIQYAHVSSRGIRSFDPHHGQKLFFQTPLTLIVGHNGAGTTESDLRFIIL